MGSNESKLSSNNSTKKKHPHTTTTTTSTTTTTNTTAKTTGSRAAAHEETSRNDDNGNRRGIRFHRRGHSKEFKKNQHQQAEQPPPAPQPAQNNDSPGSTTSSTHINAPRGGSGRRPSLKKGRHSTNILTMIKHPHASMRKSFSSGSESTDSSDTSKTTSSTQNLDNNSATNYLADGASSAMISAVATAMGVSAPSVDSHTSNNTTTTTTTTNCLGGRNAYQQQEEQLQHNTPQSGSYNQSANNDQTSNEQSQTIRNEATLLHPSKSQIISERQNIEQREAQIHGTSERLLKELYLLPESDSRRRKERDRQHYLLKYVWRANFKVPLQSPTLIVNWCCGTGIWAMEMAQQFPSCQVIGMDFQSATLSSLGRSMNNLSFRNIIVQHDTTGLESLTEGSVDYLMMRDVWLVNSPGHKWVETLEQVFRVLKPGGWIEIYEQDLNVHSPGPFMKTTDDWYSSLFESVGIQRTIGDEIASMMHKAGYIEIDERTIELPVGEWSSVPALKETGYLFKDLMLRRFRTFAPWLCEFNNVPLDEVNNVLEKCIIECEEYKTSMCWKYFAGQKPTTKEKAGLSA